MDLARSRLLACALLFVLSACRLLRGPNEGPSMDPDNPAARQAALSPGLTLGPGDLFEVRVFQEPDLSGVFRLGSEGTIDYPLCGRVKLLGLTAGSAVDLLTGCLKPRYLKDPHISILVRESNSKKIFVFGEVQRPGTFPYEEGMSVVQAVTLAGGFTRIAAKNSCTVTRRIDGEERRIKVPVEDVGAGRAPNFGLLPGDILFVPESLF